MANPLNGSSSWVKLFTVGVIIGAGFKLGEVLMKGTMATTQQYTGLIPDNFYNARTVYGDNY